MAAVEAADAQAGLPYIGSLISLISNSEIRYEGTLYTIDMNNSTIALSNVRSFGTEGRRKDGPQVAASDTLYDYIIFRGSDIKDLTVLTNGSLPPQPAPAAAQDPAIVSATVPQGGPQAQQNLYPQQNAYLPPAAQPQGPWGMQPPAQPAYAAPPQYSGFGQSNPWAPSAVPQNQPQLAPPNHTKPPGIASPGRQPPSVPVQQNSYEPASPSDQTTAAPVAPATNASAVASSPAVAPTVTLRPRGQESAAAAPSGPRSDNNTSAPKPAPSSYANAAGANAGGHGGRGMRGGRGHNPVPASARGGGGGRGHHPSSAGRGPSPVPVAGRGATRAAPPVHVPPEDFNFDEALKKFNKEEVAKEVEQEVKAKPVSYNKDDFFDSMSCEALERLHIAENGQREDHRTRLAQQRKVDMETFGQVMRHNHGRHGGRYHSGRGRGGYGGRGGRGPQNNMHGGHGGHGGGHGGPPGLAARGGRRTYL